MTCNGSIGWRGAKSIQLWNSLLGKPEINTWTTLFTSNRSTPPSRDRCLLSIKNRNLTKPQLSGTFAVIRRTDDTVIVERSYQWLDDGRAFPATTLNSTEVSQERIASLAREFIAEFFRRVSEAPK